MLIFHLQAFQTCVFLAPRPIFSIDCICSGVYQRGSWRGATFLWLSVVLEESCLRNSDSGRNAPLWTVAGRNLPFSFTRVAVITDNWAPSWLQFVDRSPVAWGGLVLVCQCYSRLVIKDAVTGGTGPSGRLHTASEALREPLLKGRNPGAPP